MRNFALGFVVAALLFCAFPVYGAVSSLVGKEIDGEYSVVVNGVELQEKAIVVDGKSFTPNRAIGDAVGYDVSFQNEKIVFVKKVGLGMDSTSGFVRDLTAEESAKLAELNKLRNDRPFILKKIEELRTITTNIKEKIIPEYQAVVNSTSSWLRESYQKLIEKREAEYNQYMQELAELEEQLQQIDSRIQQLEEETKEYQNRTP